MLVKSFNKIGFGTNLIVGQSAAENISTNPKEAAAVQRFKEYLAKDGKNWNAELTYDKFQQAPVSKEETEKLITAYAQDYDYDAREKAQKNIAKMEPKEASDFIEKMVSNPDTEIGIEAASMAGNIKDDEVAVKLIEKLSQNPNSRIKSRAIFSLEYIENNELVDKSIEKFLNSKDAVVKKTALEFLYKMPESKNFDKLFEMNNDPDPKIRREVLFSVDNLKDEKYDQNADFYESIIENGLKDSNEKVKTAAFYSIGKLRDSQKAANIIREIVSSDMDGENRERAAASAGYIKDTKIVKPLIEELLQNDDKDVRKGATSAIFRLKDEKLQNEFIEKIITSNDLSIKKEMAWGISRIKDLEKAFNLADKLLMDPDSEVRSSAIFPIRWMSNEKLQEKIINKYIQNPDLETRKEMVHIVANISQKRPEKAKEYAQILSKDENKYIQKKANQILEQIKADEQQDGYKLKITDKNNVIAQEKIQDNKFLFDRLKSVYNKVSEN